MNKNYMIIGLIFVLLMVILLLHTLTNITWGKLVIFLLEEREYKSCMDNVKEFCYDIHKENNEFGVSTQEYNKCKFETFHNRCSQLDCLKYYGYNVKNPESLTKETAQELVDKSYLEPRILECFVMKN